MALHPLAGKPAPKDILVDLPKLLSAYYTLRPAPAEASQRVSFGTSGHRGSSLLRSFNEAHILATTEAICRYRHEQGITGPLFMGKDTHGLSEPAQRSALEVFAAHGVTVMIAEDDAYTPTPAVSRAIIAYNRGRESGFADGVVITPSHNPPEDGGFKYNPPHGGPADSDVTNLIQDEANRLLDRGLEGIRRVTYDRALAADSTHRFDFVTPYVEALAEVVDLDAIQQSGMKIGVVLSHAWLNIDIEDGFKDIQHAFH